MVAGTSFSPQVTLRRRHDDTGIRREPVAIRHARIE